MCQAICYTGLADLFYRTIGTAFGIFDGWRRQQEERLPENVTPHWCLRDVCEFRIFGTTLSLLSRFPVWAMTRFGFIPASGCRSGIAGRSPSVGEFA